MSIGQLYQVFLKSSAVCTDTRKLQQNDLFFALKGPNFDGNTYALKALEQGAYKAVVDDQSLAVNKDCIVVEDVLKTLQALAKYHRDQLSAKIIAIGGSNGKTTTKELLYATLSTTYKTQATQGNLNNHIGLPLTLLSIKPATEFAIVELGANKKGDNKELCEIATPDFAVVTNYGKDHLEGYGSLRGVIEANDEIFERLKKDAATAFVNTDDAQIMQSSEGVERVKYGKGSVYALQEVQQQPFLSFKFNELFFETQLIGLYNTVNLSCVLAIAKYFNVQDQAIQKAFVEYTPSNNRSSLVEKPSGTFILDAYNANPTSMLAAIESLSKLKGLKGVLLGDMFELGDFEAQEHLNILKHCSEQDFSHVLFVGKRFEAFKDEFKDFLFFSNREECLAYLAKHPLEKNSTTLVKGSRSMKMELIVEQL